jgi:drug/metabolite transporter (DMT)-like permease
MTGPARTSLTTVQKGALLALGTAAISGLSIYLNAFGVKQVPDAAVYTTLKNGVAAFLLVGLALSVRGAPQVRRLDGRGRLGVLAIAIIGGSVPFLLFFTGLAMATAPTAAFIHKTLFIWVAVMAVPLLGERFGLIQVGALATLLVGQLLIAPPTGVSWGGGETMILAATLLWSVEVVIAKRLLSGSGISPSVLGAARMGIGFVILVGYLVLTGRAGGLVALGPDAWFWVLVTGTLLAGYVATWYAALALAPATVVTSVLVAAAVVTGVLSAVSKGAAPDIVVVGGYLLVLAGVGLTFVASFLRPVRGDAAARAEA